MSQFRDLIDNWILLKTWNAQRRILLSNHLCPPPSRNDFRRPAGEGHEPIDPDEYNDSIGQ